VPVYLLLTDDVANLNFEITYDTGVVAVVGAPVPQQNSEGILAGNLDRDRAFRANPGDPGIIRVGFAGTEGINRSGTVAWILFRAVGQPGDRTQLTVSVTAINQPDGTEPAIDRIHGAVIITDENGLVPGDCNGDGDLDAFDAVCALEISVGLRPVQLNLDLDASGDVTSRDATLILQRDAGIS